MRLPPFEDLPELEAELELEPLGREAGLWWCEPGAGGGTGVGGETGPESGEKWPCWVLLDSPDLGLEAVTSNVKRHPGLDLS